jgi:excisionase family DNA binding protein
MEMSELLTLPEVWAQLRVSRATVTRLIAKGQLPVVKVGRRTFITRQALDAFVQHQQVRRAPDTRASDGERLSDHRPDCARER